jgi:hypothetical protein
LEKAESDGSFWKSLGGILTGIAAIMTAIASLIGVWYQWVHPARHATPTTTVEDEAAGDAGKTASTADPAAPTDVGRVEIGDAVLAEWQGDGCLYPGDVRGIKDGYYHVYFAFDEQVWIAPEGLVKPVTPMATALTPGVRVYAEVEDVRTKWIPSTVKDVRDGRYYLVFDEDAQCRPSDKRHVWAGVDRIVMSD